MRGHRRGPQFGSMWRVELRAGQQQGGILEAGWPAIVLRCTNKGLRKSHLKILDVFVSIL